MPDKVAQQFTIGMVFVVLVGMAAMRLFDLTIRRFFKKSVDTEYVTKDQCTTHRTEIKEQTDLKVNEIKQDTTGSLADLKEDIGTLKGLILISIQNDDGIPKDQKNEAVILLTANKKKER